MQIDYALILSAGLGTRMGEIGKKIPKVLWPIYAKTLLELQIRYCEELGVKKIFINTHFLDNEIRKCLEEKKIADKITVLHESTLLGSGGAIHNLAKRDDVNYTGNLLLVNGDQFLFFDKKYWDMALSKINNVRAVLFGITVEKTAAYNETVLVDNCLIEIRENKEKKADYITYSGLGLLNLKGLKPVYGVSRFFESVANYKGEKIEFITPENFEYWDFGTAGIYAKNIFSLADPEMRKGLMGHFLNRNHVFNEREELFLDVSNSSIDLEFKGRFSPNAIQAKGHVQNI